MLFEAMRIDEIKKMKFKDLALGHSYTNRGQEKRRLSKETDKKDTSNAGGKPREVNVLETQ